MIYGQCKPEKEWMLSMQRQLNSRAERLGVEVVALELDVMNSSATIARGWAITAKGKRVEI